MQKYEVIRMVEHDGRCHISMDCVEGTLLIYRVQKVEVLSKNQVLSWISQLVRQLELYHRCGPKQYYHFLNPYSVLVTRDEKILLLDLEAESNEFVILNMQKRAMRNHFVKPILQIRENTRLAGDLYGLGKTIQFLLACTEVSPSFTYFEEYRLSKLIQKCLSINSKKKYENLRQVQKDIPKVKREHTGGKRRTITIMMTVIAVMLIVQFTRNQELQVEMRSTEKEMQSTGEKDGMQAKDDAGGLSEDTEAESKKPEQTEGAAGAQSEEQDEDILPEMEALRQAFLDNTKEGNEKVIHDGELLKSDLLYYLAVAYDREEQRAEAIQAYGLLCQSQCEEEILEQAFYRKASLEQENQQLVQARETCEKGLEMLPESEKLKGKLQELDKEETDGEKNGAEENEIQGENTQKETENSGENETQ